VHPSRIAVSQVDGTLKSLAVASEVGVEKRARFSFQINSPWKYGIPVWQEQNRRNDENHFHQKATKQSIIGKGSCVEDI
jgi:hypothetical protein